MVSIREVLGMVSLFAIKIYLKFQKLQNPGRTSHSVSLQITLWDY